MCSPVGDDAETVASTTPMTFRGESSAPRMSTLPEWGEKVIWPLLRRSLVGRMDTWAPESATAQAFRELAARLPVAAGA